MKIASLFHVRTAFLRSVNVALDFGDPASSREYVVTGFGYELFERLSVSVRENSSERAWRITGDYGSGKSAFALCFARIAAGQSSQLPVELRKFIPKGMRLEPVLVSGAPEQLEISIQKGLAALRKRVFGSSMRHLERFESGPDGLIQAIDAHGNALRKQNIADGVLLILDELGQNLHHAALQTSGNDISLLQTLGERADRSGRKPFVVVAMLHQGLSTYSADLDLAARREWEKVAGRFKEIVFAQPIEQVVTLVAEMLGLRENKISPSILRDCQRGMKEAIRSGLYGAAPAESFLVGLAHRLYPLHPTAFPVLVRLLRRFGQNERSLVGFLSSYEPNGFREFAEMESIGDRFYRLPNLFDFFKTNLASSLVNGQAAQWDVIDSTVAQAQQFGEPDLGILKTIGLINLINDPGISATEELVLAAVDDDRALSAIRRLHKTTSIIHERGNSKGFSLWPHSSVNLDVGMDQAEEALSTTSITARSIAAMLPSQSLVARRHYIETGNLRHFSVCYLDVANFRESLSTKLPDAPGADGKIIIVVTNDHVDVKNAETALDLQKSKLGPLALVGISAPATKGLNTIRELNRWLWIKKNLKELAGDAYARARVAREIKRCQNSLEKDLDHLVQLGRSDSGQILWYDESGKIEVSSSRGILPLLSDRCRKVFSKCPLVPNELINRRVTSSAASRARSVLIEAIASSGDQENLGFDLTKNPPEYAIYLSVLQAGELHIKTRDRWHFRTVKELSSGDPLRLAPSLERIHELLIKAESNRCSVPELFDALRSAPYGVRDGFLPLLLAIYVAGQWDQTAIYEDGTFVERPGSKVFQRLAKEPEAFHLQHCSVRGVRRELINEVASVLNVPASKRPDVLQIVRPLMEFTARLPEYSLFTDRQICIPTKRVRVELLKAREPATLLFHDLPLALGFEAFLSEHSKATVADARRFSEALNSSILELRESYPRLISRLGESILSSFHFQGSVSEFREQITRRIAAVQSALTERDLKVFAVRVGDSALATREWIESVATYVSNKGPERWRDSDEDEFHQRMVAYAGRFGRSEAAGFNGKAIDPDKLGRAVRFTLTRPTGEEVDEVIHWNSKDDEAVEKAKNRLKLLMGELGYPGLAAAAQFVWESLRQNEI